MSRDHSHTGIRYRDCDLCGFTYRESELVLNTAGLHVCVHHDVDEGEYRFAPLASTLTNYLHGESLWDVVFDTFGKIASFSPWDSSNTHWDTYIYPPLIKLHEIQYDTSGNVVGNLITEYLR